MTERIFGYDWDAFKRAQQGDMTGLRRPVAPTHQDWSDDDQTLLDRYKTVAALEAAGFHGTADRMKRLFK